MSDAPPRFTVSHARHGAFRRDGLRPFYEYRDLGIAAATSGRFHAQVIRPNPDSPGKAGPHRHALEFQIVYVLSTPTISRCSRSRHRPASRRSR